MSLKQCFYYATVTIIVPESAREECKSSNQLDVKVACTFAFSCPAGGGGGQGDLLPREFFGPLKRQRRAHASKSPYNMMQRYLLGGVTATVASVVGVVHNLPMALNCSNKDRKIPARPKTSATTTTRSAKRARGEGEGRTGGAAGITGRVWGSARVSSAGFDQWSQFFSKKKKKKKKNQPNLHQKIPPQKKFPIILKKKQQNFLKKNTLDSILDQLG